MGNFSLVMITSLSYWREIVEIALDSVSGAETWYTNPKYESHVATAKYDIRDFRGYCLLL